MKIKSYYILNILIVFGLILFMFSSAFLYTNLNASANTQGFLSEDILPIGTELNNLELKFDTEKEPYKAGKNLFNITAATNSELVADADGMYLFIKGGDLRASKLVEMPIPANNNIIVSVNILESDVSDNNYLYVQFYFADGTNHVISFSDLGYSSKTFINTKEILSVRLLLNNNALDVDNCTVFSGVQIEIGQTASAYVPYYYAPAVNSVRLFTDSKGGYLGYKTYGDVITYGYFTGQNQIIFWANERLEDKGIFESGWQMSKYNLSDYFADSEPVTILTYQENYQLHYRDTVFVTGLPSDNSSSNWLDDGLKQLFGEDMTKGTFFTSAIVILVGVVILRKVLK